jgi:hypothetical protein
MISLLGVFAGLPFWGGGLTLLAAAPGIGNTSWLLRMLLESSSLHIPSRMDMHSPQAVELSFRVVMRLDVWRACFHSN